MGKIGYDVKYLRHSTLFKKKNIHSFKDRSCLRKVNSRKLVYQFSIRVYVGERNLYKHLHVRSIYNSRTQA